jgi:hypothetical protein
LNLAAAAGHTLLTAESEVARQPNAQTSVGLSTRFMSTIWCLTEIEAASRQPVLVLATVRWIRGGAAWAGSAVTAEVVTAAVISARAALDLLMLYAILFDWRAPLENKNARGFQMSAGWPVRRWL